MKVVSIQFPCPGGSREMSKRICNTGFLTRLLVMCSLKIGMSAIRSSPMALSHINLFSSLGDLDFQLSGSSEVFNLTLCISEENVSTRCLEVPWSNQTVSPIFIHTRRFIFPLIRQTLSTPSAHSTKTR